MKLLLSLIILVSSSAWAGALSSRKVDGITLFQKIKDQGVSASALKRAMEFFDINRNKKFAINEGGQTTVLSIDNQKYLTIIDFTLPSSQRRLYLIDTETGVVKKYYVAHGMRTGGNVAYAFSNIVDSNQSSLGIYLTGNIYYGSHGTTLQLHGLEKSNSTAWERAIVLHGADYVSLDFLNKHGRMGRSLGCPAVSREMAEILIPKLQKGSVLYLHHDVLIKDALKNPLRQNLPVPPEELRPKPAPPKPVAPKPTVDPTPAPYSPPVAPAPGTNPEDPRPEPAPVVTPPPVPFDDGDFVNGEQPPAPAQRPADPKAQVVPKPTVSSAPAPVMPPPPGPGQNPPPPPPQTSNEEVITPPGTPPPTPEELEGN
ncbi:MAG: murein L,D-transpeptidase catalytic domain family protein [Bdellovibrionota bacterium]